MRKNLFLLLFSFVMIIIITSVAVVNAVSYEEARSGCISMRTAYLSRIIKSFPPPADVEILYLHERHEKALMTVNYYPQEPERKRNGKNINGIRIYKQAFEEIEYEDNFLSALFHEFNHLRAFSRTYILEDGAAYFKSSSDLKWKTLYRRELYDNELFTGEHVCDVVFQQTIRTFLKYHITEMLAVAEEIHLHENDYLNTCESWRESRYQLYNYHFLKMVSALNTLEAKEDLFYELVELFKKDWFQQKMNNYRMVELIYGF